MILFKSKLIPKKLKLIRKFKYIDIRKWSIKARISNKFGFEKWAIFRIRIHLNSKIQEFSNFEPNSIRHLLSPEFRMRFESKFRPESRIPRIRMDNPII